MSSSVTAGVRRPLASSVALWVARVLFGLFGVVLVAGTIFFTFFASVEEGGVSGPVDGAVAVWSMIIALGYLYGAVRLGDGTGRTRRLAAGFVVAHIAFGLVKYFGYGEREAVVFFAADLLLLGLLAVGRRRDGQRHTR